MITWQRRRWGEYATTVMLGVALATCSGERPTDVTRPGGKSEMQDLGAIDPQLASSLSRVPALGAAVEDARDPATTTELVHLVQALESQPARVADLFEAKSLQWASAPDPSAWLAAMHAAAARARMIEGETLRLVTFNLALLDARIFWGLFPYARSPLLEERRVPLAEALFGAGYDIVLVQELWRPEDVTLFVAAAERFGYRTSVTPRATHNDGLATFIKASIVDASTPIVTYAKAYQAQDWTEYFPGPKMRRGYQWTSFAHTSLGRIGVANTHTLAFPRNWHTRMLEARELGVAIGLLAPGHQRTLIGGDFNAAPYYPRNDLLLPDGERSTGWWNNAMSYALFAYYANADDLVVAGRADEDALADVTAMRNGELSPDGWPFTANGATNELYRQQYDSTEYAARLDHVFARASSARYAVVSSGLVFHEPVALGGTLRTELSDHYGVEVTLRVAPSSGTGR